MAKDDSTGTTYEAPVVRFPQSKVTPPGANNPTRNLGLGKIARAIGASERQTTGHWCSRCRGIWYGYLSEVSCPVCGNRQG
ncbi:hypothetical protein [Mesorhizobium sp. M1396]|uniref:hypothetical protein n=1 Tax=Mesorhizobium sp. M1396 TaxID=2957095 RepID=UPI003338B474